MCVFSHILGVDLKRNTKNPCCLFVCFGKHHIDVLYSSVAKRFSVLLIGKQTAQGSFHNFIAICLHLHFFLSLCFAFSHCLSLCLQKIGMAASRETDSTFTLKGYPSALQPNSCHVFWEHYSAFEILPW